MMRDEFTAWLHDKGRRKLIWYKNEFENISKEIKEKDTLTYLDFLRIRNFKLQNSTKEEEIRIKFVTSEAFKLAKEDKIKEAITWLVGLDGVAIPIASTILAMKYPDKYAIIDRRVIKKLGKNDWLKKYLKSPEIYEEYLLLMRKLAKDKNIRLRDFERGLFEEK